MSRLEFLGVDHRIEQVEQQQKNEHCQEMNRNHGDLRRSWIDNPQCDARFSDDPGNLWSRFANRGRSITCSAKFTSAIMTR